MRMMLQKGFNRIFSMKGNILIISQYQTALVHEWSKYLSLQW